MGVSDTMPPLLKSRGLECWSLGLETTSLGLGMMSLQALRHGLEEASLDDKPAHLHASCQLFTVPSTSKLISPRVEQGLKKTFFCVPTDELLRAKDDLLSEGGQSLNSIFADCFGDWFIGIPFVGDDVMAKCISKLH